MGVPTLKNLLEEGVSGRGVLVRSDFNVPLDGSTITDPGRILASLPTLNALIDAGAKVIITAHLGRPKGEPDRSSRSRPSRRVSARSSVATCSSPVTSSAPTRSPAPRV